MSEQLALTAAHPDKMVGKEIEVYTGPRGDEIPAGAQTTDEVEGQQAAEAAKSPDVRISEIETELTDVRNKLAELGSKRSTSIRNKTYESLEAEYQVQHGKFTKLVQDLVRAKLELAGHSELEAKFHGMKLLDDEWTALRNETKDNMNGTITGKMINWLGNEDDSKVKRIAKLGAFIVGTGVVTAGAVALTGGLGGGAVIGGAIGAYARGYKGYVMRASKGRGIDPHVKAKAYEAASEGASLDDILAMGADDDTFSENVQGNHELNRKAAKGAAIGVALGATAGAALDYFNVGSKVSEVISGNNTPAAVAAMGIPQNGHSFVEAENNRWAEYRNNIGRFEYSKDKNPFFEVGKTSDHAMGPALESRPELDMGIDGWNDLVQDRWVNSPEQFASVVSAMGIDGIPSDISSANDLAEHFKVTPSAHADMHSKVIDLLNQPTTHVYELPIENDYASELGVGDRQTGDVNLAWDEFVGGQRGTKIVIEFEDPNTGEMRKIELRKECGGQRIVEFQPAPVHEVTQTVWNPNPTMVPVNNPETPVYHTPETPVDQPEQPTPPVDTPSEPTEPQEPTQPDDSKKGRNPGVFEDQDSGPLTEEFEVEDEVSDTTGRDIGGGQTEATHTDTVINEQGTQQNGSAQNPNVTNESHDTSSNSQSGSGVGQGDTSGGTTSTDNGADR